MSHGGTIIRHGGDHPLCLISSNRCVLLGGATSPATVWFIICLHNSAELHLQRGGEFEQAL